jgi:FecR protein
MPRKASLRPAGRLLLLLLIAVALVLPPGEVRAQVQQGATLTILRGQIALVRADGSAIQPAPSGSTVNAGDEIRTISRSGALITFFTGTEIELGEETILVVEQASQQGDRIDVSLRQVFGATVNRVQALADSGSTYQIQAGGAVALVRGTSFGMVGPVTTSVGNVVTIACREDCSPASTFSGCAMAPFSGIGVTTSGGKVDSGCHTFAVDRAAGLFDAAHEGVTTVEQAVQGDTNGVPAGQVAPGSRQETDARRDQQRREAQEKDEREAAVDPPRPPSSPTPPGPPGPPAPPEAQPCNAATNSGGAGVTTTVHNLGRTSGTFAFSYQAFDVPDRFEVFYKGNRLLDTGLVPRQGSPGAATVNLTYGGASTTVTVIVTGSQPGTAWTYTVACPA